MADAATVTVQADPNAGGGNAGSTAGNAGAGGQPAGTGGAGGAGSGGGGQGASAGGATNTGASAGTASPNGTPGAAGASTATPAGTTDPAQVTQIWGDKWREAYAGEDKAKLAVLSRFTDPKSALDALFAAQEKIRTGAHKEAPGKDAKPEDVAAYRKANGIPETAEDYTKTLPEGLVLGEVDKDAMGNFLKSMHDKHVPSAVVHEALASYAKAQGIFQEKLQKQDLETLRETNNQLRADWQGVDYDANINNVKAFIESQFPKDVQEALINGRLGDEKTTPLLAHPGVIRSFANLARMLNPAGTVTSGAGIASVDTINDRIKTYENRMAGIGPDGKNNPRIRAEWFKDEKGQQELRDLYSARERLQAGAK